MQRFPSLQAVPSVTAVQVVVQHDPGAPLAAPAAGQAFWYLVRGRNACGTGTYGYGATNGIPTTERVTQTCP